MLIFKLDKDLLKSWNPTHSFIQKLSRRMSIETSDFYLGLETGFFLRKDRDCYIGRTVSKETLRSVLYASGVPEDSFLSSESLGTRRQLSEYADKAGLPLSALIRLSENGDEDPGPEFTAVGSLPDEEGYYSSALDAAVLVFLHVSNAVSVPVSYLEAGCGKAGWNPTLSSMNKLALSAGISLETLALYAKPETGIVMLEFFQDGYEEITMDDARSTLFSLYGTDDLSQIAGKERYLETYQNLRRNDHKSITMLILLRYLKKLGMTLPEFFRACKERKH